MSAERNFSFHEREREQLYTKQVKVTGIFGFKSEAIPHPVSYVTFDHALNILHDVCTISSIMFGFQNQKRSHWGICSLVFAERNFSFHEREREQLYTKQVKVTGIFGFKSEAIPHPVSYVTFDHALNILHDVCTISSIMFGYQNQKRSHWGICSLFFVCTGTDSTKGTLLESKLTT